MDVKDKRIEVRVDNELHRQIKQAAEAVHEPASEFIRKAAQERAQTILAQELVTLMDADQFDELLASLDVADEAPVLAELAQKPRMYKRG